jgi:Xaa-Pro aminopeptidase
VPEVLIVGDTVRSPELRHEVPLGIGDPFLYAERNGSRWVAVYSMEAPRIEALGTDLQIVPFEALGIDELIASGIPREQRFRELLHRACERFGIREATVPHTFPLAYADFLRSRGLTLTADKQLFDDRRRVKSGAELEGIRRAQRAAEAGMAKGRELLAAAEPRDGVLWLDGAPLTSERIKAALDTVFGEHGASTDEAIVSHGAQTAIGHDGGSGEIRAGEPVLFDLFPRDRESGCFADMTRTFVAHGEPPQELREWHALCKEALDLVVSRVRAGVNGHDLHRAVSELFHEHGHPTQVHKEPGSVLDRGYYHALGHGVGLDVHEKPDMGMSGDDLVAGDVIAVEPGLYRPGFGGERLEDLLLVTEDGCENLTDFPYELEIR